jgi:hypothetical protein
MVGVMAEARSETLALRVKAETLALVDEWRDGNRDAAGDRLPRSEVLRRALVAFLGSELAKLRAEKR